MALPLLDARRWSSPSPGVGKIRKTRSSSVISKILQMFGSCARNRHLAAAGAEPADGADEDTERRRVDERRAGKVDEARRRPGLDRSGQRFLELRRGVDVGLAQHDNAGDTVAEARRRYLESGAHRVSAG